MKPCMSFSATSAACACNASHHVSYFHADSGWAFVGDVAGVRVQPADIVLAPTPPPDIDIAAWEASIATVARWEPEGLALTHFGPIEDPPQQLAAVREALHAQAALVAENDMQGFIAAMHARVAEQAGDAAAALEQAAPLEHLYLGLKRWHDKRG
jgi:glyoxylase-like metal-dependent hydrolase (beta-lactamase superfamily II)